MHKILLSALAVIAAILFSGCATIFSGSNEEITITTDPQDAHIYLNDRLLAQGATSNVISRSMLSGTPLVRVERKGYKTQEFRLKRRFNTVAIFNLTLVPSWATDFVSGAMFEYEPNKYHVQLLKEDAAQLDTEQNITRLVMVNSRQLRRELAAGQGEIIESVARLAEGEGYSVVQSRERLLSQRQSLIRIDSPLELAQQVNLLLKG